MSGSERRNILIDGRTVWYRAAGEGPPVILVHGLSGSTRWWERNVPVLARHFRVYIIDLPGFGENRRAYRFELVEASARLVAWMDAVGIERASIVGHSMGGFIAADLAAAAPDRIERLVLVDAAARPYDRRFWQPA